MFIYYQFLFGVFSLVNYVLIYEINDNPVFFNLHSQSRLARNTSVPIWVQRPHPYNVCTFFLDFSIMSSKHLKVSNNYNGLEEAVNTVLEDSGNEADYEVAIIAPKPSIVTDEEGAEYTFTSQNKFDVQDRQRSLVKEQFQNLILVQIFEKILMMG